MIAGSQTDIRTERAAAADARAGALDGFHRWLFAIDARRWREMDRLTLPGAAVEWPGLDGRASPDALERLLSGVLTHQQSTNAHVALLGEDEAEIEALSVARHRRPTMRGDGMMTTFGTDRARLERGEGGWRLAAFAREIAWTEGDPGLLSARGEAATTPPATAPLPPSARPRMTRNACAACSTARPSETS